MNKNARIYVAGHTGLVGSSLVRKLQELGYSNLLLRTHEELDLTDQAKTASFFAEEKPEYVFLAAARVGGIFANENYPAEFIYDNLQIQNNIIDQSHKNEVKKLLFFGSSCMYPKNCKQPMQIDSILTGPLEPTNEPYALAKLSGMKMCQSYNRQYGTKNIVVIPAGLYGMNDNFHPENSHVIPALIRRFHEAKVEKKASVTLWGTGSAQREFLFVDDMAEAILFLMENYEDNAPVNVGYDKAVSIKDLAIVLKDVIGFEGALEFDTTKPDGMPIKQLDSTVLKELGWSASKSLKEGLALTYEWYLSTCK
ncbi:GDP-fucose synthetase [Marinomonas sp. CT5]|uniref:GDP-L-fucose synthase family protein n=1 Tax=Marinomonas sp. CT5 TaxID=2066133 RepID=UPI001BAF29D0|nr:GDP-L-fucose synthase [Marinomonas sp. CT5]QUX97726.1 GDP-fucose synthetase [Marinomonas sp. CT5]